MPAAIATLGIDRWPVTERIALIHEILDSIARDTASALTPSQRTELERRLAEHAANPMDVVPWAQIEAEALARFKP